MQKTFSKLLKNLCCSQCKSEFDDNSVTLINKEKEYISLKLHCNCCGKDFGTVFLKLTDTMPEKETDISLTDRRDIPPINSDDVIDAHEQIKDFEENWKKFLKND